MAGFLRFIADNDSIQRRLIESFGEVSSLTIFRLNYTPVDDTPLGFIDIKMY
jgi:hypothetical protein